MMVRLESWLVTVGRCVGILGKLKDSELECLEIQAEIAEIEEEKVACSQELIELNREALEWEKKVKMARETKAEIRGSKGENSDTDNMRQEIQRMSVIYRLVVNITQTF